MVAGHLRRQVGRRVRLRGGDGGDRAVLDEHVRGDEHQPGDGVAGTGVQQGDRRPVTVADEHRPFEAELVQQRRQHAVGLVVHVRHLATHSAALQPWPWRE